MKVLEAPGQAQSGGKAGPLPGEGPRARRGWEDEAAASSRSETTILSPGCHQDLAFLCPPLPPPPPAQKAPVSREASHRRAPRRAHVTTPARNTLMSAANPGTQEHFSPWISVFWDRAGGPSPTSAPRRAGPSQTDHDPRGRCDTGLQASSHTARLEGGEHSGPSFSWSIPLISSMKRALILNAHALS